SPPLVTRLAQGPLGTEAASAPAGAAGEDVPGELRQPSGAAMRPPGRDRAHEQVETTRLGAEPDLTAGTLPAGACDQLLRGAEAAVRPSVPGSLTGDHPDARDRAGRFRAQRGGAQRRAIAKDRYNS